MALIGTSTDPIRSAYFFGWALQMRTDDGRDIRVLVTDEALEGIASPRASGLDRLNEYRSRIEEIASAKHTAGHIEPEGTIRVTPADVR
jgi:hypothetical protein